MKTGQFTSWTQQWDYVTGKVAANMAKFNAEADPTKIARIFGDIIGGLNQMYSLAMQLKQMTDSLATSITQTRRSMQMDILPDAGKVDFVNTEWNTKWVQYQAAKEKGDKELMTLIGQ
jgi:hypothetical protein